MNCTKLTKYEADSQLYEKLYDLAAQDEAKAEETYLWFRTSEARDLFGDFIGEYPSSLTSPFYKGRIDNNGEPLLKYDARLNKHYFLDKNNEKIYYPFSEQGLQKVFSISDIKLFAETIALNFFEDNQTFDFETLEFSKTNDITLKEYVEEFVTKKASELKRNSNFNLKLKGIALENTLEDINEWVSEVKDFYAGIKIKPVYEKDNSKEEEEESSRGDLMRKESWTKSSKDNINNNIKLYLSLIKPQIPQGLTQSQQEAWLKENTNKFGELNFYSFDKVYNMLLKKLSGKIAVENEHGHLQDMYDIYLEEVLKIVNVEPNLKVLYDKLRSRRKTNYEDKYENFRYQFVNAFKLYRNNFLGSEYMLNEDGSISYTVRNLSDVGSKQKQITGAWQFKFEQNTPSLAELSQIQEEAKKVINSKFGDVITEDDLIPYLTKIKNMLNKLGIDYSIKAFDYYLNDLDTDEIDITKKVANIRKMSQAIYFSIGNYKENSTPISSNQAEFRKLAEAEAFFQEEGTDASIFTIGKTKWVYSLPSYIDLRIAKWKNNPRALQKFYNATPYNKSSLWMEYLVADGNLEISKKRLDAIEVGMLNSVQQANDSVNARDNKSLSYTDSLVDYSNKVLAFKKGAKVYHKTALAADKSTEYQIYYGDVANVFNILSKTRYEKESDSIKVGQNVTDILFNYIDGEYRRIGEVYEQIKEGKDLVDNYHTGNKNGLKMLLFPSLNYGKGNKISIYTRGGKPKYDSLYNVPDNVKAQLESHINEVLSKNIKKTYSTLKSEGLLEFNEKGELQNVAFDSQIYDSYKGKNVGLQIAGDIFINSLVSQVEYAKMFTGDLAYYKNIDDYKKRVPASYTDGLYLTLNNDEKYFNIAIGENVKIDSPSLEKLKENYPKSVWKHYSKEYKGGVNATDAQAWITPMRWRFLLKRAGKWNSKREEVYRKMLKPTSTFTNEELKLAASPLKGVYFDLNNEGKPVFLKYSQAVLVPNLVRGTDLEILANKMMKMKNGKPAPYSQQTHEFIVKDGIKVGSPAEKSKIHNEDGSFNPDFELTNVVLNNAAWKLQQDLPTKGVKDTVIGSQIQKNIFQGLVYNGIEDFHLGNGDVKSGTEVINYLNDIIGALSNIGKRSLKSRFGIEDGTFEIKKEGALYNEIIAQLKNRRDVPANYINALKAGVSPYGIPGAYQLFQNVFSSIVNKALIKVETNGAGFIQMSDYGLSKSEASARGMVFTPWFKEVGGKLAMPTLYKDENGVEKATPGGIFLSGSLIAKYVPDYKSMSSEKLFGKRNEKTGKYEDGVIDERILRNIIGYRIPNQGLPSNDALEVMGILPEEIGDVVIPYTGITTKTGSDFDIDKMYLMIPSFFPQYPKKEVDIAKKFIRENVSQNQIKIALSELDFAIDEMDTDTLYNTFIHKVLLTDTLEDSKYYDEFKNYNPKKNASKLIYAEPTLNDKGEMLPPSMQSKETLQNLLIDAYKTVLTHPKVIQDVLNPIDVDYIESDIKSLITEEDDLDLKAFSAVDDIAIKSGFMLGKSGLGQHVNSLVDAVRGSMANLGITNTSIGWGYTNENDETIFDSKEYSEELTKDEIANYIGSNKASDIEAFKQEGLHRIKLFESMMALANGFVDVAKDDYIIKGNWVSQTNNVGAMLLRAGAHPFKVNAFLAQNIIKEFVKFQNNQESQTINNSSQLEKRFILMKAKEYFENNMKDISTKINDIELTPGLLFDKIFNKEAVKFIGNIPNEESTPKEFENFERTVEQITQNVPASLSTIYNLDKESEELEYIKNELIDIFENAFSVNGGMRLKDMSLDILRDNILKDEININLDLSILRTFKNIQIHAKTLTKNVTASKVDVEGKGKNINSLIVAINRISNILDKEGKTGTLFGFRSKLIKNNNNTLLENYIENGLDFVYNVMRANPKLFLGATNMAVSTYNEISNRIYGTRLENDVLADKIEKAYTTYVLSGFKPLQMSKDEKNRLLRETPIRLRQLKESGINNLLINELYWKPSKNKRFFVSMSNIKKSVTFKNNLTTAWKELLADSETEQFAEDLIKYSYLTTGFNNSINQFHEFIPYEWFNKNGFNSYFKDLALNKGTLDRHFINQFFRHNYNDFSLVKTMRQKDMKPFSSNDFYKTGFITKNKMSNPPYMVRKVIPRDLEAPIQRYYVLEGLQKDGTAVYLRTSLLGLNDYRGNKVFEYNINPEKVIQLSFNSDNALILNKDVNGALLKQWRGNPNLIAAYDADMIVEGKEGTVSQTEENQPLTDTMVKDVFKSKEEPQLNFDEVEDAQIVEEDVQVIEEYYTDKLLQDNPDKIYVFGDNLQRKGKGGQAKIRDNENAYGIVTKLAPKRTNDAYMTDNTFEDNIAQIDQDIQNIIDAQRIIVFPKDGLGTGLAKLKEKAPKTYAYLKQRLLEEFGFNNDTGEIENNKKDNNQGTQGEFDFPECQ